MQVLEVDTSCTLEQAHHERYTNKKAQGSKVIGITDKVIEVILVITILYLARMKNAS